MIVEDKLASLGFPLPDLEAEYRRNTSGAHFVSHRAVGSLLFLSGTVPIRDGSRTSPASSAATSRWPRRTRPRAGR